MFDVVVELFDVIVGIDGSVGVVAVILVVVDFDDISVGDAVGVVCSVDDDDLSAGLLIEFSAVAFIVVDIDGSVGVVPVFVDTDAVADISVTVVLGVVCSIDVGLDVVAFVGGSVGVVAVFIVVALSVETSRHCVLHGISPAV